MKTILSSKFKKINKKAFIFWSLFSLIYFVRLLYIDADIRAPWGVLNYQPFDEGCYGSLALHKMTFGTINPNNYFNGAYEYSMESHVINNLIGNVFSYLPMKIFGKNYLGFRLGPIIAGYIIAIIFVLTLKEFLSKYDISKTSKTFWSVLLFTMYLIMNFVFYNASRIVEPTIYRLLFLQLIVYVFIKQNIPENFRNFLLGFLTISSIFFVYITNLFIMLSLASVFLFYMFHREFQKAKNYFLGCLSGGIVAYILSFIYYYSVWNTTPIKNALKAIFAFQSVSGYEITKEPLLDKFINFLSSNIFLYNPLLVSLLGISVPYLIYEITKKKNKEILFLLSLILGLFLQTLISEDYIVRKALIILPTILYLDFIYIIKFQELTKQNDKALQNYKKRLHLFICISMISVQIIVVFYRLFYIKNNTNLDFSSMDTILVFLLMGGSIAFILYSCLTKEFIKHFTKSIYICMIGMLLINAIFVFKYNFYKNTYSDKAIMQQLGELANGKIVCFSYENTNTLYNDILPLLCPEDQILEYMKKDPNIYYYGFADFADFNTNDESLNQHVEICYIFEREFETFGVKRQFALFKYKE